MGPRLLLASLLSLACASSPVTPRAASPTSAPPEAAPLVILPPASGDSLTLTRGSCYPEFCPKYTVTLYATGRVDWRGEANVARIGPATAAIDPAAATRLLAGSERLDLMHLPADVSRANCGPEPLEPIFLRHRRGDATTTAIIDGGCLVSVCDELDRCVEPASRRAREGLAHAARLGILQLARAIDDATQPWVIDPDCLNLRGRNFAAGVDDDPDGAVRHIRDAGHTKVLAAASSDPRWVVRIAASPRPEVEHELATHRDALIARGLAPRRIAIVVVRGLPALNRDGVEIYVGPAECFAAVFPTD